MQLPGFRTTMTYPADNRFPKNPFSTILPVILLTLFSVLCAAFFFTGYFGSDDMQYSALLRQIRDGTATPATLGTGRWIMTAPYAAFASLFQLDGSTAVGLHSIYYLLLVAAVVLAVRMTEPLAAAVTAGFLVAACPLVALYSGALLPDNLLALLAVAEFSAAVASYQSVTVRRAAIMAGFAGGLHALAYTLKEPTVLFLVAPVCLIIALFLRERKVPWIVGSTLAACFAAVFALDLFLNWAVFGDPILRLHFAGQPHIIDDAMKSMQTQGTYPGARLITAGQAVSYIWGMGSIGFGDAFVIGTLLCPALLFFPRFRDFPMTVLTISASAFLCYNLFGSISLNQYVAAWIQPRYMATSAVLFLMAISIVLHRLLQIPERSPVVKILTRLAPAAAVVVAFCGLANALPLAGQIYFAPIISETRAALPQLQLHWANLRIYASPIMTRRFLGYGQVPGVGRFNKSALAKPDFHALVLVDRREGNPAKALGIPPSDFEITMLDPATLGVKVWDSRLAQVLSLLSEPDVNQQVPPRFLVVYEVRRTGAGTAGS